MSLFLFSSLSLWGKKKVKNKCVNIKKNTPKLYFIGKGEGNVKINPGEGEGKDFEIKNKK